MKSNKAFTLIELLVVVLIIGILAAIAVPKYQKAVSKSELQEAILQTKSLITAQQEYRLATGTYATNLDNLSINFNKNNWSCGEGPDYFSCKYKKTGGVRLEVNSFKKTSTLECVAGINDEKAKELCIDLGGKFYYDSNYNTTYYLISRF